MLRTSAFKKPGVSVVRSVSMNQNGAVLIIALVFMILLTLLGLGAVFLTTTDMKIGANYKDSELAFNNAQAGVQYAIGKMEEGLKAWPRTFTLPITTTSTPASPLISTFAAPTGFMFTYPAEITRIPTDSSPTDDPPDIYEFTCIGTTPQGSTASITARVRRLPAINFGAFGDELLDLGNLAGVYSYSHTDCIASGCHPLDPSDSTDEGDIGSNESVILRNSAIVNGDVALGEDINGNDGTLTDQGGVVSGSMGADIPRTDPDPLGIVGGELAAAFITYSATNDNGLAVDTDGSIKAGPSIDVKTAGDTLTLKGKTGGANYYFTSILVRSSTVLYIDTTSGPVNIYLTGEFTSGNGAEVVNTTGCGSASDPCSCPPSSCTPGAPGDFTIFANSQNDPSENITLKNSSVFSGVIYAPCIEVVIDNSADVYGAIMAKRVDIVNNVEIYYDTDLKDKLPSNDLQVISWQDNRM